MKIVLIVSTFIWSGLILGISFIEAPLKFKAPNMTTELGLGIGKLVLTALNRVELLMASLVIIGLVVSKCHLKIWYLYALPLVILLLQTFILLPILDNRVDQILSGYILKPTNHHIIFVVLEIIKLISLITVGVIYLKSTLKSI